MDDALQLCEIKKRELDAKRPLDPEVEQRAIQKLRLDWNYHSNHLEGNSLSYGETKALILYGLTAQGKPLQDHFEITGHNEAVHWIEELVSQKTPLTEHVIRQLHVLILKHDHYIQATTADGAATRMLVEVGKYKTAPNHVLTNTGETIFFTPPLETPHAMRDLLDWYAATNESAILKAALFHYRFIRIHPFADGNGRVARLVMNFILMMSGYPPVIVKTEDKATYLSALRSADAGQREVFFNYIAKNLEYSLDLMLRAIRGEDIDEPDDLNKELALLKTEFDSKGVQITSTKSAETVSEAWNQWIRPWMQDFESKWRLVFQNYYTKYQASLARNSTSAGGSFTGNVSFIDQAIGQDTDRLFAQFTFSGLKKIEVDDSPYFLTFDFLFLDSHILIKDGISDPVKVPYGIQPSSEVLSQMGDEAVRHHIARIRQSLKQIQS